MDGENNEKPYEQMDDLGGFPIFLETPICDRLQISPINTDHLNRFSPLADLNGWTLLSSGRNVHAALAFWNGTPFFQGSLSSQISTSLKQTVCEKKVEKKMGLPKTTNPLTFNGHMCNFGSTNYKPRKKAIATIALIWNIFWPSSTPKINMSPKKGTMFKGNESSSNYQFLGGYIF